MESTRCFEGFLVDLGDENYATLRDIVDDQSPKELLRPSGLSALDRQRLNQTIAEELGKVSLPMPASETACYKYLQENFLAKHLELSEIAYPQAQRARTNRQGKADGSPSAQQPHDQKQTDGLLVGPGVCPEDGIHRRESGD
jgi:hypothetical protein